MNPFKLPPFWFLLATVGQFGIAWYSKVPAYSGVRIVLGYIMIGIGVVLVLATWRAFRKWETPICPFNEPNHMITDGPFLISRNPLYLGEVVMLVGLAFLHGVWQAFVTVPLFILVIEWIFIRHEEATLRAKYGAEFKAYALKVRKWI